MVTVASGVKPHRFTRADYERMIDAGVFAPEARCELIEGEIIDMTPQKSLHATAVCLVSDAMQKVFGSVSCVRVQLPLSLGTYSEPEPDIAVVAGSPRDYRDAHPKTAVLVVEVSDSTLAFDRSRKLALYARAGIPEYWIVNLIDRQLEVYRGPAGTHYREERIQQAGEQISLQGGDVAVADLLP